jgi:hypothetical protein
MSNKGGIDVLHLFVAALLCLGPADVSGEAPGIAGVRKTIPLNGKWFGCFTDQIPAGKQSEAPWQAVTLPLDAAAAAAWSKPAVFRTEFLYAPDDGFVPRFIRLSKVQALASVCINGTYVGQYRGYYRLAYASEFGRPRSHLIPDGLLKPGANEILIRLEEDTLWKTPYRLGGIQDVPELVCTGKSFISSLDFLVGKPNEVATYTFIPGFVGPRPRKFGLLVERFTGKDPYSGPTEFVGYSKTDVPKHEARGTPGREETRTAPPAISWTSHPHFATYRATVVLLGTGGRLLDAETTRFHTVYAEVKGKDFLLNNEKFIAKGAVSLGGQLLGEDGLTYCNWFNFNMIRLDFMGRDWLDAMWRHGVLAMELVCFSVTELPRVWNPKFPEDTLGRIRPVVEEYAEHPAIIYWNSANEVSNADAAFLGALYDVYKKHDPYRRPVTYAGIPSQETPDGQDVMGVNYGNTYEALKTYVEHAKGKPVFSTEWRVSDTPERLRQYWGWLQGLNFAGGAEYGTVAMLGRSGQPNWEVATKGHKWMYRDLDVSGFLEKDGNHVLEVKNISLSSVRDISLYKAATADRYSVKEIGVGASVSIQVGREVPLDWRRTVTFFLKYTTHHGLPHSTFEDVTFQPRR